MIPGIVSAQSNIPAIAPAIFPEIRSIVPVAYTASSSHAVTIGQDVNSAVGDRLFVIAGIDDGPVATVPAGWNSLYNARTAGAHGLCIFWRDKAAPNTTANLTLGVGEAVSLMQFALEAGTFDPATNPVLSAATVITSTTADLAAATDTGVYNQLVIGALSQELNNTVATYPMAGNNNQLASGSDVMSAMCTATAQTNSYDPGSYVMSGSARIRAITIMQRGA